MNFSLCCSLTRFLSVFFCSTRVLVASACCLFFRVSTFIAFSCCSFNPFFCCSKPRWYSQSTSSIHNSKCVEWGGGPVHAMKMNFYFFSSPHERERTRQISWTKKKLWKIVSGTNFFFLISLHAILALFEDFPNIILTCFREQRARVWS